MGNVAVTAAQIGGGAAGGIAGIAQAQAIRAQGEFQRRQFQFQQRQAELQARDAIQRGQKQELRLRQRGRKLIGAQRTALAAQGIEIGPGLFQETAALTELDAITIRNNAAREALGLRLGEVELGSRARITEQVARFQARSTLLTGGLQFTRGLNVAVADIQERRRKDKEQRQRI